MQSKARPQWKESIEEGIAVACMALLVAITLLNVLTRYLTNESFAWTEELSVLLMVVMTLAGASAVARRDQHIRIEFFLRQHRGLWLFGAWATSLAFVLLAALLGRWVWDQYRFSETSMGLGVPLWWYGAAIVPLCLAIAVRAFSAFVRLWRHESRGAGGGA